MNYFQYVEMRTYICEKAIESNPDFDQEMQLELKTIVRSDDSGEKVLQRLAAYYLWKLL